MPYAVTNRLTGAVKTYYHKLYTDLDQNQNTGAVVGSNLGTFVDPGFTQVPVPNLSVPPGTYSTPQTLKIVNPLPGTFFYYTTDGSTPARAADGRPVGTSLRYSSPIPLPAGTTTIKVIAHAGLMTPSNVISATYNSNLNTPTAAPVFSIPAGIYPTAQTLTLTSVTNGAVIRYTLNGQNPTSSSGTIYSSSISVPVNTTVKAIAYGPGLQDSSVVSARYTSAAETLVVYSTGNSFAPGVTGKDLLETSVASLVSSGSFKNDNTFGIPALVNGNANHLNTGRAGIGNNSVLTYKLNTTASPGGYIIKNVDIFTGSFDSYWIRPNVKVSYSLVGTPNTFVQLAIANYTPPEHYAEQPWTKSSISSTNGVLVSGVAAIRFNFTGSTHYSELDVIGVPFTALPQAPSSMMAALVTPAQINLSWIDNSFNETGFKVYRSPNGYSNWSQIASPSANTVGLVDTAVAPNTVYFYQSRATNANGDSEYSEIATAKTPASENPTFSVSGKVLRNGSGLAGVTISDGTRNANTGNDGTYTILNVPVGTYTLTPTVTGLTFNPVTMPITVNSSNLIDKDFTALASLDVFRASQGLAANGTQDFLTPAGDEVENLLKYAFNMIGNGTGQKSSITNPNSAVLSPSGNAGMPLVGVEGATGKMQLTYIRRKVSSNPGISLAVEFSESLAADSWAINPSATENTTLLDATFERVTVTDSVTTSPKRFVRVKVTRAE